MKIIFLLSLLLSQHLAMAVSCVNVGVLGEFQSASSRASFAYGTEMIRGVSIAQSEQNHICVKTFNIDINNSISNIDGSIRRYSKDFGVHYFIGLGTSAQVQASIKAINETSSLLLSPTATNDDLLKQSKNIVLMSPTNNEMLLAIVDGVMKRGYKRASIIYGLNDIYSKSMAEGFAKLVKGKGLEIVLMDGIRTGRNTKIDGLNLKKLNQSDFLFLPVYELDVIKIVGHLFAKGFNKRIVGTDSWGSNSNILQALPPQVIKQLDFSTTAYYVKDSQVISSSFFRKYKEVYKKDPMDMSAFSYEALKLVFNIHSKCQPKTLLDTCLESFGEIPSTTGKVHYVAQKRSFNRKVFLRSYE